MTVIRCSFELSSHQSIGQTKKVTTSDRSSAAEGPAVSLTGHATLVEPTPLVLVRGSKGSPLAGLRSMWVGFRCPQVGTHPVQVVHDPSVLDRKFAQ